MRSFATLRTTKYWLAAALLGLGLPTASLRAAPCTAGPLPGEEQAEGWERSFGAACVDSAGTLAVSSELLHLVPHKGRLYAATGMWMDPRNPWYGGPKGGGEGGKWAQILRLDGPRAGWQVDLEMPQHLRAELLFSATFSLDGQGRPLAAPQTLLLAAAYLGSGNGGISLFTRDDAAGHGEGRWERSQILPGPTGQKGEGNSVRAMRVHRDRVTGVERLFVSVGVLGVFSGVFDPAAPGKVRWDRKSETGMLPVRPLAIVEANGELYFSADKAVYRRVDGPAPRWERVLELSDLEKGTTQSPVGGIRGLTAIDAPSGGGQSLLFVWEPGARSRGCMIRLDPLAGFARTQEACLDQLAGGYLDGIAVPFVLAGYNDFLRLPGGQRLVGMEVWVGGTRFRTVQGKSAKGGFYAGALYAVREAPGRYRMGEVNGRIGRSGPALESTRSYALSPFAEDAGQAVYFGGFDCNEVRCSDTGWIFRADVATVLRSTRASR